MVLPTNKKSAFSDSRWTLLRIIHTSCEMEMSLGMRNFLLSKLFTCAPGNFSMITCKTGIQTEWQTYGWKPQIATDNVSVFFWTYLYHYSMLLQMAVIRLVIIVNKRVHNNAQWSVLFLHAHQCTSNTSVPKNLLFLSSTIHKFTAI